jgi:hypothetical protein
MANGLELLLQLMGGGGGTDLKSMALGFMLPQLPRIAKQFTMSDQLPQAPGGAPGMAPPAGQMPAGGMPGGVPPQLLPLLMLAARAQQQGGGLPRPAQPGALPRVVPMDQSL